MKNHFKYFTYFVFVVVFISMKISVIFAFSSGPPFSRTGSPADGFKTCNDTGCHNSFLLNSGSATFSISAPKSYAFDEVLNITVSFANSSTPKHGFELSALDANNNHVGAFGSVDSKTQTSFDKNYIEHTSIGSNQSGNASWDVTWTAPPSTVQDPVTFYAAGNEANGDGTHDGDFIYTTTTVINHVCRNSALSASPNRLKLKLGESSAVIVTLIPDKGCPPKEGKTVRATINMTGLTFISIPSKRELTNINGEATFMIVAKNTIGNAKVTFRHKTLSTTILVKIR